MSTNIKPMYIPGLNCFENSIISILDWKLNQHELSFVGSWGFSYNYTKTKSSNIIGDKISSGDNGIKESIYKYYGINLIQHKKDNVQETLNIIQNELSKQLPIGIIIDAFYCPWKEVYKKEHSMHFCTIVSKNETGDFNCIDSMPIIEHAVLSLNDFINGYEDCITFDFPSVPISGFSLKMILNDCINKLGLYSEVSNPFKDMRFFANSLENLLSLSSELHGYTYSWDVPLLNNINNIHGGRFQIAKLLVYLQNIFHDEFLLVLSEQFRVIVNKWAIIRGLIYKVSMITTKTEKLTNIANRIREVADLEESAADMLCKFLNNELILSNNYQSDIIDDKLHILNSNFIFLDLDTFFNNKGFGNSIGSFSSSGEYFLIEGLPANKMWIVQNMKFIFTNVKENKYDNISCNGQVIQIPNEYYSEIMLLGCAEWASLVDNLIINYADGTKEILQIAFSEWNSDPLFEENIAWQGNAVTKTNSNLTKTCRIFAKSYKINNTSSIIDSICLPNCKNIHIFSISLLRKSAL